MFVNSPHESQGFLACKVLRPLRLTKHALLKPSYFVSGRVLLLLLRRFLCSPDPIYIVPEQRQGQGQGETGRGINTQMG